MHREVLVNLRRSLILMGVFAASFVLVYTGVVALTKFVYIYFRGFIPEYNENILRVIFYSAALAALGLSFYISGRRYSPGALKPRMGDPETLVRHLLITPVIAMAFAEAVLICGFFLFFLSAMYADYFILCAASLAMIVRSVPKVDFLDEMLRRANGHS